MTRVYTATPAWRKVLDRSAYDPVTGCLRYGGRLNRHGYGYISIGRTNQRTHRVVYSGLVGPIPTGWTIDHDCHTRALAAGTCLGGDSCLHRACVNVDHLIAMTAGDNVLAGNGPSAQNARATSCIHGHEFDTANTYLRKVDGARQCRKCHRARYAARRLRARQTAPGATWCQPDLLGAA